MNQNKTNKPVIVDGDFTYANDGVNGNRVFVSFAKTVNLGNYESMKVEFGIGRTVADGQSFNEVKEQCKKEALLSVGEMVKIIEANR